MGDSGGLQQAKLVLLGDMGAGKSSLVLRFVKGKFFDYQVSTWHDVTAFALLWATVMQTQHIALLSEPLVVISYVRWCCVNQESTIGAAFLTKTMPEQNVKFEIW